MRRLASWLHAVLQRSRRRRIGSGDNGRPMSATPTAISSNSRRTCAGQDKTGTATHSNQTIHRTREKASRTVNRADTLGSKRSSRLSRSKRLKKQSVAVERSVAIERLERFEPAPLLDAHCPRPERLAPRWLCTVNIQARTYITRRPRFQKLYRQSVGPPKQRESRHTERSAAGSQ